MTRGEIYYLALVLVAFTAFGVALAVESWLEGKRSGHN
jgi:hypothetical protein